MPQINNCQLIKTTKNLLAKFQKLFWANLVENRQTSKGKKITLGSSKACKAGLGQIAINKPHIDYITQIWMA